MNEAILKRRSIRKYKDIPVSQQMVEQIIQAGILAPSAKNRQPWKFIVVCGEAKAGMLEAMSLGLLREENGKAILPQSADHISGAKLSLEIMRQAPVTIFIVNTLGADLFEPLTTEERIFEICNTQSIGAAIENMSLQAESLGLGSLWICDIFFAYPELCDWLHTKGELFAALSLGFADEEPAPRPRKEVSEVLEWRK